jgi:hypothetical protein
MSVVGVRFSLFKVGKKKRKKKNLDLKPKFSDI